MSTHVTYEQVIGLVKALPPEKLPSLYDYLQFLQSPYSGAHLVSYGVLEDDDLIHIADDLFAVLDDEELSHHAPCVNCCPS
jgi:hypothetical protein